MKYVLIEIIDGVYITYHTVDEDVSVDDAKRHIELDKIITHDSRPYHLIERVMCEEGQLYCPGTMKHIGHITDYTHVASV